MAAVNPFFILRLSAHATATDIRGVGQRMLARARLGDASTSEVARMVESSLEQLRDPVQRFFAGLEAPQLGAAAAARFQSDPRFASLATDACADLSSAIQDLVSGESELIAQHARGCFGLLRACALVRQSMGPRTGVGSSRARGAAKTAEQVLMEALDDFRAAIVRPEFWIMQRMRAKQIDDPRLAPDKVQRIQASYPEPLLQHLCELASTALLNRCGPAALAIIRPLQTAFGQQDPLVERALGEVYRGVTQRIEAAVKHCEERAESLTGPEGAPFERALVEFQTELEADLELLRKVGDLPGTFEERARDAAATFFRGFGVAAGNKATACGTAIAALELARRYAVSPQLKANIKENLSAIKELSDSIGGRSDLGPIFRRMEQSHREKDHRAFLRAVQELTKQVGEAGAGKWKQLEKTAASNVAAEIFQLGVQCANLGQRDRARLLLEEALRTEPFPDHRTVIQKALGQLNGSGRSGCLIPLALLLTPGLTMALGPTLWRAAHAMLAGIWL